MYLGELVEYGPAEQVFGAPRAAAHARLRERGVRVMHGAARSRRRWPLALAAARPQRPASRRRTRARELAKPRARRCSAGEGPGGRASRASDVKVARHDAAQRRERHRGRRRRCSNTRTQDAGDVPILIDVRDAKGKKRLPQRHPGPRAGARRTCRCSRPGGDVDWVNDQVLATGKPKTVEVEVGAAQRHRRRRAARARRSPRRSWKRPRHRGRGDGDVVNEAASRAANGW